MTILKSFKIESLKFTPDGLLPVVVQDCRTFLVLNLKYVNKKALKKTIETKYAHYYNKEKKKIVMKGEQSGYIQRVIEILVGCDRETLIFQVEQKGLACKYWMKSCFHNRLKESENLRRI